MLGWGGGGEGKIISHQSAQLAERNCVYYQHTGPSFHDDKDLQLAILISPG